jgi:Fe-S cluster biogenesis protein NfuA/nitrite reductase/ring-hydroxylating ferredoxin subunit
MSDQSQLRRSMEKIEHLVAELDQIADPNVRARAVELVQLLMDLHGTGFERLLSILGQAGAAGKDLIERATRDDVVASLLLLYGLHPVDLETRVRQALDKVRPYLKSHGGNVELLGIEEGVVSLSLQGSCHGCPSSAMTLKLAIEEAIYGIAPDVAGLLVEGFVEQKPASGFVPIGSLAGVSVGGNGKASAPSEPGMWEEVDGLASLKSGSIRARQIGDRSVLLCRIEETFYAYGNECPGCQQRLDTATLDRTTIRCAHCGQHYDVMRAGRGLDHPTNHLEPFPLLVEKGSAKIAIPCVHA